MDTLSGGVRQAYPYQPATLIVAQMFENVKTYFRTCSGGINRGVKPAKHQRLGLDSPVQWERAGPAAIVRAPRGGPLPLAAVGARRPADSARRTPFHPAGEKERGEKGGEPTDKEPLKDTGRLTEAKFLGGAIAPKKDS